jgi:signal transduction histidine kinase
VDWAITGFLILLAFANFIFSAAVTIRDHKNINNIAFSIFSLSIALWVVGIAGFLKSNKESIAYGWAQLYYLAPVFIALAGVTFANTFPNQLTLKNISTQIFAFSFIPVAMILLFVPNLMMKGVVYHSWGKEISLYLPTYALYSLFIISSFSYTLFVFHNKAKTLSGLYSRQADLFFKGVTIAALFGVLFNLIFPLFGNYRYIEIGPMFTSIIVAVVGYSMVRNRMFDLRLFIARAITYTISILVLSTVYGFIIFGIAHIVLKINLPLGTQTILSLATGIAGLFFGHVKSSFDDLTTSLFYRDSYDAQAFLDRFNKVLVSTFKLTPLIRAILHLIEDNLKPTYSLLGIKESSDIPRRILGTTGHPDFDEEDINYVRSITPHMNRKLIVTDLLEYQYSDLQRTLQQKNVSIIARLARSNKEEGIGYLVLGPKKSGNAYSSQDLKILEIVANELVVAIQNALHTEEIEKFNLTLQERVKNATGRLRLTNEKLKSLDEAKDDFVSMASHQLRTPLTSVKGNISLVLDGDAGEINSQQRQLLEAAFTSSQRMVFLIADLLNVSRLKTGKFIIERAPVNLADVIEEEVNQLIDTALSRQLTLTYKKPENITELMLDDTKTRQVIMNFIDNAIYYTPAGGRIDVVLSETASVVECRVIDNGIGVPKSEQRHLFTKFFRAVNARKARPDGTGLGLFMAKKIIASEGGAIIFESVEGKGSTFGFSFPKAQLAVNSLTYNPGSTRKLISTT